MIEIFSRAREKGEKDLNDLKFGTFAGCFPSDGGGGGGGGGGLFVFSHFTQYYFTYPEFFSFALLNPVVAFCLE